ncbi:MAG TPA: DUF4013 domain-containing protein [Methanobacteriaceae archaeon]|nr:DUF4013 domain-containing protein [Methanobacteriaceae archaeon]
MDVGDLLSDATRYPLSDWKKLIILGLLFILSILIIPGFLALGYVFRVLKASIAGSDELPDFDQWGEMFLDGFKVFVVQIAYFLIPGLVIFLGLWTSINSLISIEGNTTTSTAVFGILGGSLTLGIILLVIFGVLFIMALANMAYHNSELKAAFRIREILDMIAQIGWVEYIIWYVAMIIMGTIFGVIFSILGIIPVIGWIILILIVHPYLYLFYSRSLGLLFVSAFETV